MPIGVYTRTEYHKTISRESHLGKTLPEEQKRKISESLKGKRRYEKHPSWKGDDVGYVALHEWVRKQKGKASKCTNNPNHVAKKYEWSNISGEYKRDITDWKELCQSCNRKTGIPRHSRFIKKGK